MPGFVLQVAPAPAASCDRAVFRVGFTVSRKVGNSVERNRVRRRLREIARQVIPAHGCCDLDHVLIGREAALKRDFATMRGELEEALKRLRAVKAATP